MSEGRRWQGDSGGKKGIAKNGAEAEVKKSSESEY